VYFKNSLTLLTVNENTANTQTIRGGPKNKLLITITIYNNFVYAQPTFIILAHIRYGKFATGR